MKTTKPSKHILGFTFVLLCCHGTLLGGPIEPQLDGVIDLLHLADPPLEVVIALKSFDPRLETLWLKALAQDNPTLQRQVIEAFLQAHAKGMNVSDTAAEAIQQRLRDDVDPHVRLSAVRAMAQFDRRSAADDVLIMNEQIVHPLVTPVLDALLAKWDHEPARNLWRKRLTDSQLPHTVQRSAIQSVGRVRDVESRELLLQRLLDRLAPVDLRLAASESLGQIASTGSVDIATQLLTEGTTGALLAVRVLNTHEDETALALLETLLEHPSPAVAAAAARRFVEVDPKRVARHSLAHHSDPDVRLSAARAAVTFTTTDSVLLLAGQLDDPSVAVRTLARNTLIAWSQNPTLRPSIEQQSAQVWASSGWRGREQVALISGWIDDKAAAERLVSALHDDRAEVRLAVCHALRQLQVTSTIDPMFQRLRELVVPPAAAPSSYAPPDPSLAYEATQLILALGVMNVREVPGVELVLRKLIPKGTPPSPDTRAAAIWVLGRWHEGELDTALAQQLVARMSDESPMNPEAPIVRRFCAIALGRMGAADQLTILQHYANPSGRDDELAAASRWAIEQITLQPIPPPELAPVNVGNWFIEPNN